MSLTVCLIRRTRAGSAHPQSHTVKTINNMPRAMTTKPAPINVKPASVPETENTGIDRNAAKPAIISPMPVIVQTMPAAPTPIAMAIIATMQAKIALITVHTSENHKGDVSIRAIMTRIPVDLFFSLFDFAVLWLNVS